MTTALTHESIQHMARAFSRSRILLTAVELDLFTLLADKPLSAAEAAGRLKSDPRATTILLDALAAMELLEKSNARYRTTRAVVPILTTRGEDSIIPSLMHSAYLWKTWSQLTEVVLDGGPAHRPDTGGNDRMEAFIGAMHVRAVRDAPELVRAVKPGTARNLIDVAGGSGSYTIGFLNASPGMKATLFDLPEVITMARERISGEGLLDRVTLVGGDYNTDELPGGHDLALLSAVIHQNSSEQNMKVYRKTYDALVPGGRIIVRDYVMSPDRTKPASGALFAVNMLVNTRSGNSYTFDEIREGLEKAGFKKVKILKNGEMSSLVEGWKP